MIECHIAPSPLGHLAYRAEDEHLTGLFFVGQKHFPAGLIDTGAPRSRVIAEAMEQIAEYFAGERTAFSVKLRLNGTDFQQRVWAALLEIPFGNSWTYGDLARRMGYAPGASRAVGAANGRNPVGIIVPCHRVIGADGELTGYAGGMERKQHLLTLEGGPGRAQLTLF
ncbi:MAG: methylated-DNA--[protein]-cysteine S-methyltransferase [Pseudomonadota bacterium]|uniref:Methylated-DNA--protein-cysteine methyltransferase n=1 Tax=Caballeronia sordidicola TaxID=196367 RepID=A0A242MV56_CABSO|nr:MULTISPECIES: methylated-DNA--[protein]-cysteine S-methyltransferase [Burkholderiaceae]AMM17197.1 cysteine methyltransferase [Burkholderia sp. PAMC 28687]MDP9156867.1 methylated-DNA--[protein]-cysteine S-methyltransferase [Pseudomonadota bacterium]OTP75192.1 Methylated-DNA--protein-cysteine methyltransferase [Caballeronia sordidicola]